jgi:pSer/pThr/pTyr-binding forkhead associated (FHA) protein
MSESYQAKIKWQGDTGLQEYELKPGDVVTLGRDMGNTIHIKRPRVSRRHACILWDGEFYAISDLGSSNGTFVNGDKITEVAHRLNDGDEIALERFPLLFEILKIEEMTDTKTSEIMVEEPDGENLSGARLKIVDGPDSGKTFLISGPTITIGRESCGAKWEICMHDFQVSRPHAKIESRDEGYFLADLGSANGTLLNNQMVLGVERLSDGDAISIGESVLVFRLDS